MSTNAADTLLAIKQPLDHRAVVETVPGLAWQLPRLDASVAKMEHAIAATPGSNDPIVEQYRKQALGLDRVFDRAERYAVRGFDLTLSFVEGAERESVLVALGRVCPHGAGVTQLSFRQQASHVEVQTLQLTRDDVKAGMAIVTQHAPQVLTKLDEAITAGRSLGKMLDAIDRVEATGAPGTPLFEARREALSVLSYFRESVYQIYPPGTEANDKVRSDPVGRYEAVLSALFEESKKPTPGSDAPPAAPATP